MRKLAVSQARAALPQILDHVLAGEEVTLTRHGSPVAVIVRPDTLQVRRADQAFSAAERIRDLVEQAKARPLRSHPALSTRRADELVGDIRASRSAR